MTLYTYAELHELLLADVRNRIDGADTGADTEIYRRMAVTAGGLWQLQYAIQYVEAQIFPDSCDSDNLDRHANTWGLTRKAATAADDGVFIISGTPGTVVPVGTALGHEDGTTWSTTEEITISGLGEDPVEAVCDTVGVIGNRGAAVQVTVASPPSGLDSAAVVFTPFTNGTELESDARLRSRLLRRIQKGDSGGTETDYEGWAETVSGVLEAWCLPLRLGAGTVSVAVFAADGDGLRLEPSDTLRGEVLAYLETKRPVGASVDVPEVTAVEQGCTLDDVVLEDGVVWADIEDAVQEAFNGVVYAVGPGETLRRVAIIRALAGVDGLVNFTLALPAADVESTVDDTTVSYFVPGAVVGGGD